MADKDKSSSPPPQSNLDSGVHESTEEDLLLSELGSTGLERFSGFVHEEFLKELQGQRGIKIYKEMRDNDPTVGAVLTAIELLTRNVDWRIKAVSKSTQDQQAKDFVEECLTDMSTSFNQIVSEIMSMLPFGWSWHEIVYKRRLGNDPGEDPQHNCELPKSKYKDGRIGWRKLPIRAQETLWEWEFDKNGGVRAMIQQPPPDYIFRQIPIEKSLLFRTKVHKGNPEGRSILRNAYRPWFLKKHIENIEAIGAERDLAGLPVAWVPPEVLNSTSIGKQAALRAKIEKIVRNVRRDEQEGLMLPLAYDENGNKLFDFTLLASAGKRQLDTDKIIQRYDQRIAMSMLADFILLGHEKVGSFALASSKTNMFSTALGAWLDEIADIFNRFAIPRLFEINDFQLEELPTLEHGDIETVDLQELGDFISKVAAAGMPLFPDKELEDYVRRQASLPTSNQEEF